PVPDDRRRAPDVHAARAHAAHRGVDGEELGRYRRLKGNPCLRYWIVSQPPSIPPRCAKCATPSAVPMTPNSSSSPPKTITNTRAGIGIGGKISITMGRGK